MDRRATQTSDTRQEGDLACTPLDSQETDKVTPILFIEGHQNSIDRLVLLGDLAVRMLLTCYATTPMDATTF